MPREPTIRIRGYQSGGRVRVFIVMCHAAGGALFLEWSTRPYGEEEKTVEVLTPCGSTTVPFVTLEVPGRYQKISSMSTRIGALPEPMLERVERCLLDCRSLGWESL